MNVLITGGAGFIGSNLAWYLTERDCAVTVLDNFSSGTVDNLYRGQALAPIKFVLADIRNQTIRSYFENQDIVFHLAGTSSLPENQSNPLECISNNVAGTAAVLEHCRQTGVKRVIFASTSAVYENNTSFPVREHDAINPFLLYTVAKKQCEELCYSFAKCYGMDITIIRYFNTYGPFQDFKRTSPPLTSYLARELINNRQPVLHSWHVQNRDYVYVDDVNDLNYRAMTAKKEFPFVSVFNAASGKLVSVREIHKILCKVLNTYIEPIFKAPNQLWDAYPTLHQGAYPLKKEIIEGETKKHCLGDGSWAKHTLEWTPKVSLEQGLTNIAEYAKIHCNLLKKN